MFLDDELLQMCKDADLSTPDGVNKIYDDLGRKCEDYYKSKISAFMRKSDVKIILDKTFNLWDSFVRMAKKDPDKVINMVGELFEKYSFKKNFMAHKEMKQFYNDISNYK